MKKPDRKKLRLGIVKDLLLAVRLMLDIVRFFS